MCGLHLLLHLHEYGKPYLLQDIPLKIYYRQIGPVMAS